MATKVRSYAPPMLYDGLPLAIKNIRTRKGLLQAKAAERGGTTMATWSQWESRTKRLLRKDLPIVTKGLGVTEFELHWEANRLEHQHYERHAAEIGEPKPIYDRSSVSSALSSLPQGTEDLSPEAQAWQNRLSANAAALLVAAMNMVDYVKDGPRILSRPTQQKNADDSKDSEAPDHPEEASANR